MRLMEALNSVLKEDFSSHSLERLLYRIGLSQKELDKLVSDVEKQINNWMRETLHKLPDIYFTSAYMPPTIWQRLPIETTAVAVMQITKGKQVKVITVFDESMLSPSGVPLVKGTDRPVRGLSFGAFRKYIEKILAGKEKRPWDRRG
jgi:hypothetical protein